jgi:hypothetical protein
VIAAGARHWQPGGLTCQGKRPYPLEGERDWLLGQLSQMPDLTLHALLDTLRDRGVAVCHCCATVPHGHWRTLNFLAALRHDCITAPSSTT